MGANGEWLSNETFTGQSTFKGTGKDEEVDVAALGAIGLAFESYSLAEGLAIVLGGNIVLGDKEKIAGTSSGQPGEFAARSPFRFALGAHYNIADFGVKARFFMRPYEESDAKTGYYNGNAKDGKSWFYIKGDIMPFYNFGFMTVYLNFRFTSGANDPDYRGHTQTKNFNKDGDPSIGWHINPYIRKQIGGSDLRIGFLIEDENGDGLTTWKLPVSAVVSF